MQYIARKRRLTPEVMKTKQWQDFTKKWNLYNLKGGIRETQERFPFEKHFMPFKESILATLEKQFHGKCAFTEEKVLSKPEIEFFRPISDASGLEGEVSGEHYWWLAYSWQNMYLSSSYINRSKQNHFPVAGKRSAIPKTFGGRTRLDCNILLDPCKDRPEWYLTFTKEGLVTSKLHPSQKIRNKYKDYDRGVLTIKAFSLNREDLIKKRSEAIRRYLEVFKANIKSNSFHKIPAEIEFLGAIKQVLSEELLVMLSENQIPYNRSFTQAFIKELKYEIAADLFTKNKVQWLYNKSPSAFKAVLQALELGLKLFPDLESDFGISRLLYAKKKKKAKKKIKKKVSEKEKAKERIKVKKKGKKKVKVKVGKKVKTKVTKKVVVAVKPKEESISRHSFIHEIKIKNFKAIEKIEIDVGQDGVKLKIPQELTNNTIEEEKTAKIEARNWRVFLGENGSGKSSILQAIGLALLGEQLFSIKRFKENNFWEDVLKRGENQGRICLVFHDKSKIDLRFNNRKAWFQGGIPEIYTFIRGYGATRLLPDSAETQNHLTTNKDSRIRVINLFDSREPLTDVNSWLLSLEKGNFNLVAVALKELLGKPTDYLDNNLKSPDVITRDLEKGKVYVEDDPLSQISDGYRSIIAMICDIMAGLLEGLSDAKRANGIVLIDEIGAHLHPQWKMIIVSKLRRIFPMIQFIVSSHEPLCLRGLEKNEVALVTKHNKKVRVDNIERSPSKYRVDQLLTSEFFGLDSTIDPDINREFQQYYAMLSQPEEERDQELFRKLKRSVNRHGILGYTRRDLIGYRMEGEFGKFIKHITEGKIALDFKYEYKAYKHDDVKDALQKLFNGKCAYCESRYAGTQPMDVEHWRPKGEVHTESKTLPGYYWLASTWSNLLPSCIDCNRERKQYDIKNNSPRKMGKASFFPVKNTHLVDRKDEPLPHKLDEGFNGGDERPLLLNPCIDEPDLHLEYEKTNGFVKPKIIDSQPSNKAECSINIYGLNRRDLVLDRREIIRLIQQRIYTIEKLIDLLDDDTGPELNTEVENILDDLLRHEIASLMEFKKPTKIFSSMAKQIIDSYASIRGYATV